MPAPSLPLLGHSWKPVESLSPPLPNSGSLGWSLDNFSICRMMDWEPKSAGFHNFKLFPPPQSEKKYCRAQLTVTIAYIYAVLPPARCCAKTRRKHVLMLTTALEVYVTLPEPLMRQQRLRESEGMFTQVSSVGWSEVNI